MDCVTEINAVVEAGSAVGRNGGEGISLIGIWGQSLPGRGDSRCRGLRWKRAPGCGGHCGQIVWDVGIILRALAFVPSEVGDVGEPGVGRHDWLHVLAALLQLSCSNRLCEQNVETEGKMCLVLQTTFQIFGTKSTFPELLRANTSVDVAGRCFKAVVTVQIFRL